MLQRNESCTEDPAELTKPGFQSSPEDADDPSSSGSTDTNSCASCRWVLPGESFTENGTLGHKRHGGVAFPRALRSKGDAHAFNIVGCGRGSLCESRSHSSAALYHDTGRKVDDHCHNVEYVSTHDPAAAETYLDLRRATVRTLSGEQLPRGQSSGPLLFGDSKAGYTIAYVFRLADSHARGRQRYYAFLALAGADVGRAFEACSMIWAIFEEIASRILQSADEVAAQFPERSPADPGLVTPVSSFLTGRAMDPDGHARGMNSTRAHGIADLVGNQSFFGDLHVAFVEIIKELSRNLYQVPQADVITHLRVGLSHSPACRSARDKPAEGEASDTPQKTSLPNEIPSQTEPTLWFRPHESPGTCWPMTFGPTKMPLRRSQLVV